MYKAGKISERVFAFYLANPDDQSFVQIGTYSDQYMKDPNELVWLDMRNSYFWLSSSNAFRIGTSEEFPDGSTAAYRTDNYNALFDTGTSFVYIPKSNGSALPNVNIEIGKDVMEMLLRNQDYKIVSGVYHASCNRADYDSLYLRIGDLWMELNPDAFVIDYNYSGYDGYCIVAIAINEEEYWMLGDGFLRNYFSIFHEANAQLGLAPHLDSKATITKGPAPAKHIGALTVFQIILIVVGALLIAGGVGYLIYSLVTRNKMALKNVSFHETFGKEVYVIFI